MKQSASKQPGEETFPTRNKDGTFNGGDKGFAQDTDHLTRRKELWEARKERGKLGGQTLATQVDSRGQKKSTQQGKGFAQDTADATGEAKSGINSKLARASKIHPDILKAIEGTEWDTGVNLDLLKKLTHDEQKQAFAIFAATIPR